MAENNISHILFTERLIALLLIAAAISTIMFAPNQWPTSIVLFYMGVRLVIWGMLSGGAA